MLIFDLFKALIKLIQLWGRSPNMVVAFGGIFVFVICVMFIGAMIYDATYHLYFVNYVLPKMYLFPSDDPRKVFEIVMLRKFDEPMEILIGYIWIEAIYQLLKLPVRIIKRRSLTVQP
jgi:hypothetical protein